MRIGSIEAEDWPYKVPSQKENEIQHMILRHCFYITQSKLQHILWCMIDFRNINIYNCMTDSVQKSGKPRFLAFVLETVS